jgi:hypothetical protein
MADIRIKDLTTTASTTAADDFFAADGATNGTRKLSAYSPSFGGNATVGGTLTVSGTSSLLTVANSTGSALLAAFSSAYASGSATPYVVIGSFSDPATSGARIAVSTDYSLDNRAAIQLQTRTTAGTLQTALTLANTRNATFAADVAISGTTASTTTSSGALVVGNGTSGGLGVGGAINAGGTISTFTGGVTRTSLNTDGTMFWGVSANLGVLTWDTNKARVGAQSTADFALTTGTSTDRLQISGSTGVITIPGTTASTSTSSGALVVSGGVGVAGAIVSGGNIGIGNVNPVVAYTSTGSLLGSGDNPQVRLSSTGSSGWAFSTYANTAADGKWSAGLNAGANRYIITNDLDLSGTAALSILPTTLAATFGGALLATGTLTANAASNAFRITNSQTPASAAATGTAGTIAWDSSYIYVCTATNTWKRVAIATW